MTGTAKAKITKSAQGVHDRKQRVPGELRVMAKIREPTRKKCATINFQLITQRFLHLAGCDTDILRR
jgi:hypothetical protein